MMYIECQKGKNGKPYYFLRESKRVGKRIIKTTLLNITPWGEMFCEQFKTFLKNRQSLLSAVDIDSVSTVTDKSMIAKDDIDKTTFQSFLNTPSVFTQGKSFGAIWLLFQVANRLGIVDALGDSEDGRLALWQVLARTMDPGSRLSSTRLLKGVEADFLRLPSFDEDRLYLNLDWIADHQKEVEQNLYKRRWGEDSCDLFLYDVTSSYFEGEQNELAAYGYKEEIHSRYKDLSMVENAFRTMKTINLEMRPLYVRKESRTRGHAFVIMLSFLIIKELRNCWINDEVTPKEGIQLLRELCIVEAKVCS